MYVWQGSGRITMKRHMIIQIEFFTKNSCMRDTLIYVVYHYSQGQARATIGYFVNKKNSFQMIK